MSEEVDLKQLNFLHPKLQPYVKVLLTHEFGLLRDLPKIHSIQCGSIVRKNEALFGDRFHLRILYCRKPLNWIVIMNGDDVTKAPDFIMEENFLADATAYQTFETKVPSLVNWCPTDVRCLLNVVLELLQLYKSYQINLLKINHSLQRYLFEYDILMSMAKVKADDVEVCIQSSNRTVMVVFLIHLNVDFSKLPTALPDSKNLTVLMVEFRDNSKNTIQLLPRIELEDAFGGPIEMPDLTVEMSLMDYVPDLQTLLQEKVEKIIDHFHHRKMLYSYLVQFFEPSLINGDNFNFKNVTFLLELNNFFCILNIHIPLDYPESCPDLQFLAFSYLVGCSATSNICLFGNLFLPSPDVSLSLKAPRVLSDTCFGFETPGLHKTLSSRATELNEYEYNENMSHEEVAKSIFTYVKEIALAEFQSNYVHI